MKRDMDLIRRIALETEALAFGESLTSLDGVAKEEFATHVAWMKEAGLLSANVIEYSDGSAPFAMAQKLTWAGCEFLDAARSDTVWSKAKANVIKPGMSFTFDLLKDWLKTEIAQGLPTLRVLGQ